MKDIDDEPSKLVVAIACAAAAITGLAAIWSLPVIFVGDIVGLPDTLMTTIAAGFAATMLVGGSTYLVMDSLYPHMLGPPSLGG